MNCWYDLDIDVSGMFRDDFVLPQLSSPQLPALGMEILTYTNLNEVLTNSFLGKMEQVGLPLEVGILFHRDPYKPTIAHKDYHHTGNLCTFGLNIIIGNRHQSEMVWYAERDDNKEEGKPTWVVTSRVPADALLKSKPIDQLIEIDRCVIDNNKLTVINTGVFHEIVNVTKPRWCFSFRIARDSMTLPWEQVVTNLKPILKPRPTRT
jgi:hypothetical protein